MVALAFFAARVALGLLLLWAALAKLRALAEFARTLGLLGIVTESKTRGLARAVVVAELLIGATLAIGLYSRLSTLSAFLLFTTFLVVISLTLIRGVNARCSCFGSVSDEHISVLTLLRSLLLAGVAGFLATASWTSAGRTPTEDAVLPGITVAAGFVTIIVLIPGIAVAVRAFLTTPVLFPTTTNRMSFRHAPMDGSANIRRAD